MRSPAARFILFALLSAAAVDARAQATPPGPTDKAGESAAPAAPAAPAKDKDKDKKPTVKVSGFVQGRFTQIFDHDDVPAVSGTGATSTTTNGFSVPRARIRASGDIVDGIGYVVEGELANSTTTPGGVLTDGYARLTSIPFHEIRFGQQKTQFGYENPEGDTKLLVANRTLVSNALGREANGANRASGDSRDIGLGILGNIPVAQRLSLEWAGTLVNGGGPNRSNDDAIAPQKDFWGRAGPAVKLGRSTLRVGASWARGYDVGTTGSATATVAYRYLFRRVGADVQLDAPWLFAAGELLRGDDEIRGASTLRRQGAYVYGYGKTSWNVGPIARVEWYDPNRDVNGDFRRRYTLGAYYDYLPINARVFVNYELDQSTKRQDDTFIVQTQVVF